MSKVLGCSGLCLLNRQSVWHIDDCSKIHRQCFIIMRVFAVLFVCCVNLVSEAMMVPVSSILTNLFLYNHTSWLQRLCKIASTGT